MNLHVQWKYLLSLINAHTAFLLCIPDGDMFLFSFYKKKNIFNAITLGFSVTLKLKIIFIKLDELRLKNSFCPILADFVLCFEKSIEH